MALNDDLSFFWCPSLKDDSGNATIEDLSGNGYNLPFSEGTWGTDTLDYVSLNGSQKLEFTGTLPPAFQSFDGNGTNPGTTTLQCWLYIDGFTGFHNGISVTNTTTGSSLGRGYEIGVNISAGFPQSWYRYDFTSSSAGGGSSSPGTWVHVLATYDRNISTNSTTHELFLNGVSQGSDTVTTTDATFDQLTVGAWARPGGTYTNYLDGRWDDVRGWNRILTQTEITNLATARGYGGIPQGPDITIINTEVIVEAEQPSLIVDKQLSLVDTEVVVEAELVDIEVIPLPPLPVVDAEVVVEASQPSVTVDKQLSVVNSEVVVEASLPNLEPIVNLVGLGDGFTMSTGFFMQDNFIL